jgi:hypothetical protein
MRRRRLPPLPKPLPKGYMWMHQNVWLISVVELHARTAMAYFDLHGHMFEEYWRNDPSYDWAAETKRKKDAIEDGDVTE